MNNKNPGNQKKQTRSHNKLFTVMAVAAAVVINIDGAMASSDHHHHMNFSQNNARVLKGVSTKDVKAAQIVPKPEQNDKALEKNKAVVLSEPEDFIVNAGDVEIAGEVDVLTQQSVTADSSPGADKVIE